MMKLCFDTEKIILMQWGQESEDLLTDLAGKQGWPLTKIHTLLSFFLHPSGHNFEHAENSIRLVDLGIHTSGSLQSSSPAQQTNELTQL